MLILMIIIAGGVLLVTLIVTYLISKRWIGFCRVALEDVAQLLGTKPSLDIWNVAASVHGIIRGQPLSVKFTNQTRSSPPAVTVSIPVRSGVAMTARRPNFFDRWCAAVGIGSPIVTGDSGFDGRIQVDTGDEERVSLWLSDVRFRESLLELFDPDVMRVVCDEKGLFLIRKLRPKETVALSKVLKTLPGLRRLAEYITQTSDSTAQRRPGTHQAMTRWGLAPGLVLLIGIILTLVGMALYETLFPVFFKVLLWALPWSLSACAVYGLAAWLSVRPRTDRHLIILLVVALTLPASCVGAIGWRYFGNGWLDEGTPAKIDAVIRDTFHKGRGGRKIVFTVDGKPSSEFSRPGGSYPRGLPVQLAVYPGYYGIPWVEAWQVRDKKTESHNHS